MPGILIAFIAGLAVFNTIFNNAYQYGALLCDSTFFSTMIWRSGWTLQLAPVMGGSFYYTHSSPIMYIPGLLSYMFPGDFMTYYALVYGAVYAAMVFVAYRLIASYSPLVGELCGGIVWFCPFL